jgi:hypothetical protein
LATSQDTTVKRIRTAVKRTLKNKVNRGKKNEQELKGASTDIAVKRYFYRIVRDCKFGVYAVTINKIRVFDELLRGSDAADRLYNWVARLVLEKIPFELADGAVELIVDKSKGKGGIARFDQYLKTQLSGRVDPRIPIHIHHRNSARTLA